MQPRHKDTVGIFSMEEVLPLIEAGERLDFHGYQINFGSVRLRTLLKGIACVACKRVGTHFQIDIDFADKPHMHLYAGKAMMTSDHILPKSRGGSNGIENRQPMCWQCNFSKGAELRPGEVGVRR